MNRVQLRTELVKRTGRYSLVGTKTISDTFYPDYTVDAGADAFLDSAVRRLDEQVSIRLNKRKFVASLTAEQELVAVPRLRSIASVQHQLPDAAPVFLSLLEQSDEESVRFLATLRNGDAYYDDTVNATTQSPAYYSIKGFGSVAVTSVGFSIYVPSSLPAADVTTVTLSYVRAAGSLVNLVENIVLTSIDGHTYMYVFAAAEVGSTYDAQFSVTQTIDGDVFSCLYDVRAKTDDTGIGLKLMPAATLGGTLIVDGWFYSDFGASDTDTCWWSIAHPDLVLLMATLEMGIATMDENVILAQRRLDDIKRNLISDDISTEVDALGRQTRVHR